MSYRTSSRPATTADFRLTPTHALAAAWAQAQRLYGLFYKTFRYRRYPNKAQCSLLELQLEECRWRYTWLLDERKTAGEARQVSARFFEQHALLPALLKAG
jgi:hypothetical protein